MVFIIHSPSFTLHYSLSIIHSSSSIVSIIHSSSSNVSIIHSPLFTLHHLWSSSFIIHHSGLTSQAQPYMSRESTFEVCNVGTTPTIIPIRCLPHSIHAQIENLRITNTESHPLNDCILVLIYNRAWIGYSLWELLKSELTYLLTSYNWIFESDIINWI